MLLTYLEREKEKKQELIKEVFSFTTKTTTRIYVLNRKFLTKPTAG